MKKSMSPSGLSSLFSRDFKKVKKEYRPVINSLSRMFSRRFDASLLDNGKKIRAGLLILFAKINGAKSTSMHFYGAMIELIHFASLIHDDIIDNGSKRRGRTCFHRVWGRQSAVLLGDYVYISAIKAILNYPRGDFQKVITEATRKLVNGEIYQSTRAGSLDIQEREYISYISNKTGSLFAVAGHIGTALATSSKKRIKDAYNIGMNIGKAFQIRDDLLDLQSMSGSILGKDTMNDAGNGIMTLPAINFINTCSSIQRRQFLTLFSRNGRSGARLYNMLRDHGSVDYATKRARLYVNSAKRGLRSLPHNKYRDYLMHLCDFIVERQK